MANYSGSREDREQQKFREVGDLGGETAIANQIYGETAGGLKLPIKVVDDGSGLGKIVATVE